MTLVVAADYRLGARDPKPLYRTNVEGTRNILSAARKVGVPRIVYTSSVATIGIPADGSPGEERTPVAIGNMIGHYKRSKYLAEEVAREAARMGMSVVIVNPSTPVGPGDIKPTPTGQLVLDAATGRMPAYVDTGLKSCMWTTSPPDIYWRSSAASGERCILGGEDMTLRDSPRSRGWSDAGRRVSVCLTPRCAGGVSRRDCRTLPPQRPGDAEGVRVARMYFASNKAVAELGYRWRPPHEAFADALSWFREHGRLAADPLSTP